MAQAAMQELVGPCATRAFAISGSKPTDEFAGDYPKLIRPDFHVYYVRLMDIQQRPASRTAIGVAVLRAMHELYDDFPKILSDPVIPLLLDDGVLEKAKANLEWLRASRNMALRSHVVLRSRYAEDCLHEAAVCGVNQYVILGSGFDTFAYRQPGWAAPLRIFEVDHPASQRAKVERLGLSGISLPPNLEFVPADFESTSVRDVLSLSSLDFSAPAFFSCLGVLVYLPTYSIKAIFQLVASFPKPSEIVFTFSQGSYSSGDQSASDSSVADAAAAVGEPWRTYHEPETLGRELSENGFSQVSFLSPQEAKHLYYRDRRDGLPPPRRIAIARAIV
jgi:methyltransferase (TIGR00027 family)